MALVEDRHRAFRTLLAALSLPATRQTLPSGGGIELLLDAVYGDRADANVARASLSVEHIANADRGSEIAPETGTLFFLVVDATTPWTPARVSGPGIRTTTEVAVPLARDALEARNEACASFPRGIDLVAIDGATVLAFPRTTRMEVTG